MSTQCAVENVEYIADGTYEEVVAAIEAELRERITGPGALD